MKLKIDKNTMLSLGLLLVMLALVVLVCVDLVPLLKQVGENAKDETKMIPYIKAYGIKGVPILIGLQVLQVFSVVFPSAIIQVLAGLCYGIWYGALLCLVGNLLGNSIIFVALRQFKKTFTSLLNKKVSQKKHKLLDIKSIQEMKYPELMVFLLFIVPGVPNGILPYIFAGTSISFTRYLASITAASIPSILLCTWIGERVAHRDYFTAAIISGITFAIVIILFLSKNKLIAKIENMKFTTKENAIQSAKPNPETYDKC